MKRPIPSPDPSQVPAGLDLARAEQKAHQEDLNLVLAKTALGKWEAELEEERNSPQQSGRRQPKTNQQMLEIGEELKKAPPQGEHPLVTDARRTFLLAEKRRCEALLEVATESIDPSRTTACSSDRGKGRSEPRGG